MTQAPKKKLIEVALPLGRVLSSNSSSRMPMACHLLTGSMESI